MDPLDDVFAAMRVQSAIYAKLETIAPWGLSLAGGKSARFGLVVKGSCLFQMEDMSEPIIMQTGDCYVMAGGLPYVLCSSLDSARVSCTQAVRDKIGGLVELGSGQGERATIICGWFSYDQSSALSLTSLIPGVLHVRTDSQRNEALQASLQILALEATSTDLGSSLVVSRLADIIFVQAIRAHIAHAGADELGWFAALADKKLGAALRAMHQNMAQAWTVEALAQIALMSRSAFALRFKEKVGETPLEYLTRWRMFKASCLLRQNDKSLGEIADMIGYESDEAFKRAFKRVHGMPPGEFRRAVAH
ncbi:cupin domain-containing protein [Undibacterium sp. Ji83W]|uniref:AraC family transcriptional regulator n=1 Tax=Undibacterium sp. Ji83W TaxID=3413043 RepID=UPI003BF16921